MHTFDILQMPGHMVLVQPWHVTLDLSARSWGLRVLIPLYHHSTPQPSPSKLWNKSWEIKSPVPLFTATHCQVWNPRSNQDSAVTL